MSVRAAVPRRGEPCSATTWLLAGRKCKPLTASDSSGQGNGFCQRAEPDRWRSARSACAPSCSASTPSRLPSRSTSITPGPARAVDKSASIKRESGRGGCNTLPCSRPGNSRSWMKLGRPANLAGRSTRGRELRVVCVWLSLPPVPTCAATCSPRARASTHALRRAAPASCTDKLPEVTPSSGLYRVSAASTWTRLGAMPSSSETMRVNAVRMPWPSSTLPARTSTVPSSRNFSLTPAPARRAARPARCGCARRSGTGARRAPRAHRHRSARVGAPVRPRQKSTRPSCNSRIEPPARR